MKMKRIVLLLVLEVSIIITLLVFGKIGAPEPFHFEYIYAPFELKFRLF